MSPTPPLPRVGLLANPHSGRGRAVPFARELSRLLTARGHQSIELIAGDLPTAQGLLADAVAGDRIDLVVALGGDGTAHLAANACVGTRVALAIVPAGTGNDNARTLGMPPVGKPAALVALADRITAGRLRDIDVGHAALPEGDRYWLGVLGAGFDTIVNQRGKRITRLHGTPRYVAAVAAELPSFRGISYSLELDGVPRQVEAMLVAVANGGTFGGGMKVCPQASVTDGLLDVVILHKISRLEFLRVFPKVFWGGHVRHPAVEQLRVRSMTLSAADLDAEADGEHLGPLPLALQIRSGALRLLTDGG